MWFQNGGWRSVTRCITVRVRNRGYRTIVYYEAKLSYRMWDSFAGVLTRLRPLAVKRYPIVLVSVLPRAEFSPSR